MLSRWNSARSKSSCAAFAAIPFSPRTSTYNVHCFATKVGAQAFLDRFGGEWFDPKERGKGLNWNRWNKAKV